MGRTLKSLYRERRTMKNIALLSLLTLAILQPLAEAQRGQALICRGCEAARLRGREDPRCRACSGLPGREAGVLSVGKDSASASAIFGKGFIISGNGNGNKSLKKVELYNPASGNSCPVLLDMQENRDSHTSCSGLVCGGSGGIDEGSTCEKITGSTGSVKLRQERWQHMCWSLPGDDKILLLGGWGSPTTTEIVSESTSSDSFRLPYQTIQGCGIAVGDHFIVTGGYDARGARGIALNTVAKYNTSGWETYLKPLNTERFQHACSSYISVSGDTVLLVTGGVNYKSANKLSLLSSTEILVDGTWRYTAPLPSPRGYLRAGTVKNIVYIFGGLEESRTSLTSILSFDNTEEFWKSAGNMTMPRSAHAVQVIENVSQTCP